jgi:hypothetical protein
VRFDEVSSSTGSRIELEQLKNDERLFRATTNCDSSAERLTATRRGIHFDKEVFVVTDISCDNSSFKDLFYKRSLHMLSSRYGFDEGKSQK